MHPLLQQLLPFSLSLVLSDSMLSFDSVRDASFGDLILETVLCGMVIGTTCDHSHDGRHIEDE